MLTPKNDSQIIILGTTLHVIAFTATNRISPRKKKKEIADYDNATRYNDYVLMQIINRFRNQNTVLLYFSDHGEEVYDYRDHKGRDLSSNTISYNYLKYQHEIPFMI